MVQEAQCTECGRETSQLFSNRPLHKGRDVTLLICLGCVGQAAEGATIDRSPCAWCGGTAPTVLTAGGHWICRRCVDLCRQLALSMQE